MNPQAVFLILFLLFVIVMLAKAVRDMFFKPTGTERALKFIRQNEKNNEHGFQTANHGSFRSRDEASRLTERQS